MFCKNIHRPLSLVVTKRIIYAKFFISYVCKVHKLYYVNVKMCGKKYMLFKEMSMLSICGLYEPSNFYFLLGKIRIINQQYKNIMRE